MSECLSSPRQQYMRRTARWKYVYHELGGVEELYDLAHDPEELRNLAGRQRATVTDLRGLLRDWCRNEGDEQALDGGDLKLSPADAARVNEFRAANMGWGWY